jgi:hypothetical protein
MKERCYAARRINTRLQVKPCPVKAWVLCSIQKNDIRITMESGLCTTSAIIGKKYMCIHVQSFVEVDVPPYTYICKVSPSVCNPTYTST